MINASKDNSAVFRFGIVQRKLICFVIAVSISEQQNLFYGIGYIVVISAAVVPLSSYLRSLSLLLIFSVIAVSALYLFSDPMLMVFHFSKQDRSSGRYRFASSNWPQIP